MEIKYFLFYVTSIGGVTNRDMNTYSNKEELNADLATMEGVIHIKVISGYLLENRVL